MAQALTTEEIAKRFGVHPNTIRNLVARGSIPGMRIGSQWRFYLTDVESAIQVKTQKHISGDIKDLPSLIKR